MKRGRKVIHAGMSGEWGWEVLILQDSHDRIKEFFSGFLEMKRKP